MGQCLSVASKIVHNVGQLILVVVTILLLRIGQAILLLKTNFLGKGLDSKIRKLLLDIRKMQRNVASKSFRRVLFKLMVLVSLET
mmetsp:Transcript_42076/g.40340  ORF Transcript_42076/g.40340 Transcript_42076/m.40340 type:complete len:85 (-) Transcript_42076:370-624(-)